MAEYKEIVTKAVIAKGKKSTSNKYTLEPEEIPNTILGCWVINNTFNGTSVGDSIIVNGSFDVNVWYSYDNDSKTAVSTKKYNYSDTMHMKSLNSLDSRPEVLVKSLKQPTVADVKIDKETISQLHARICPEGNSFYIEDLNSTNGTFVNDETLPYKQKRILQVNDIVQFADARFRFC